MRRGTAKRICSWIVFLAVVGTFLSTGVYDVMALENEQIETSDVELYQEDSTGGTLEELDKNLSQIEAGSGDEQEQVLDDVSGDEQEEDSDEESGFIGAEMDSSGEADEISEIGGVKTDTENDSVNPDLENPGEKDLEEEYNTELVSAESIYMLYITHTLLYTKDGKGKHVQGSSQVLLTQEDFEDGTYNLMKQAYDWEAVTVSPGSGCPEQISMEDFWEDGESGKEYYAEIRYTVKDGWEVRFRQGDSPDGTMLYSIYEGAFDNIEFVPVKSITLTVYYKYSDTGGLAGIDVHAPDEIVLPLNEDGKADLKNWRVPNEESNSNLVGFRIILNPDPLNDFLVNPDAAKNPSAYPDALENGDLNLRPGVDLSSSEYKTAWDNARTITVNGITFTYIAPTTYEGTEATTSDDVDKRYTLNASGLTGDLTLTVYYRRDMGKYTVNYWLRGAGEKGSDQLLYSREMFGRIGTLTNAKHLEDKKIPTGYFPESIAQEVIGADNKTEVDVYYSASQIRVIFNTDYIYIKRQQVDVGGYVDFSEIDGEEISAARVGYGFAGWQYKDVKGNLQDVKLTENKLRLTSEFLKEVNLEGSKETTSTSIQVLNLYPKWEEDKTTVRVIFWTENLNGHDVKVTDSYYDFNMNKERNKIKNGYEEILHQDYQNDNAQYTNAGSFTIIGIKTNKPLVENGKLIDQIQSEIDEHLAPQHSLLKTVEIAGNVENREVEVSDFYKQQGFKVLGDGEDSILAAADGSTQINVFFARKEYTLDFIYYFLPTQIGKEDQELPAICTNTANFYYPFKWPDGQDNPVLSSVGAEWTTISLDGGIVLDDNKREVPRRTVITAKYGADLRGIWPGSEDVDTENNTRYVVNNKSNIRISWTPTAGIHHEIRCGGNDNVPGAYSTMSAAIVANTEENSMVHHLVAFWKGIENNTYRYNYCYEVPELTPDEVIKYNLKVSIIQDESREGSDYVSWSEADKEIKNSLYLVPDYNQVITKYGFSDLLTYNELALTKKKEKTPTDLDEKVKYYVIRIYNDKCYAVSRQLVAISALGISAQNPSARPNLTLVNTNQGQDHSTELNNSNSAANGGYVSPDNPYDIYFYYKRAEFTITYMSDGTTEIGKIKLPYGASLKSQYNIPLKCTDKAVDYAWSAEVEDAAVCPRRSENETKEWKFLGWYLSPSGDRSMEWKGEIEGDLRLYAEWEEPLYTVEFDWDGGVADDAIKEQNIPAGQSFVKKGKIPQPDKEGYILDGWQIIGEGKEINGEWIPVSEIGEFYFDKPITSDLNVQAVWTPSSKAEISYTVYFQVEGKPKEYVAQPKKVTGSYSLGTVVCEYPAVPEEGSYRNYVPLEQNLSIKLEKIEGNEIVFHYVEPSDYPYQIKYVKYKTDANIDANVILSGSYSTKSASLLVYPEKKDVDVLDGLGYWVVNDAGKPEENGAKLGKAIQPAVEKDAVAVFYVLPKEYEICYTNLEVMGEDAEKKLGNPTSYTSQDPALTLNNPEGPYLFNGIEFKFLGWRMERTKEIGPANDELLDFGNSEVAEKVTIQPGSRGRLIFQAVWTPESYVVYFYPGDSGVFSGYEPVIDFGGLVSNTPLEGNVTVPTVIPNEDDTFIGWRWEEGDRTRLYTDEEILAMSIENRDLHFTARYRSELKGNSKEDPEENPKEKENSGGGGGSDGSDSSDSIVSARTAIDSGSLEEPGSQLLPQTGMNWIPAWVLGVLGIMFLCVGIWNEKKGDKKKED